MDIFLLLPDGDQLWLCGGEIPVATDLLELKQMEATSSTLEQLLKLLTGGGRVAKEERLRSFFAKHDNQTLEIKGVR